MPFVLIYCNLDEKLKLENERRPLILNAFLENYIYSTTEYSNIVHCNVTC